MNRRTLLRTVGAGSAAAAGCLGSVPPEGNGGEGAGVELVPPTLEGSGECSSEPADRPLSERLVEEGDPEVCTYDSDVDIAVENERSSPVTVDVETRPGSVEDIVGYTATYELDPGERVLDRRVLIAGETYDVRVEVDGTEVTGRWPAGSCYRRGVAIMETENSDGQTQAGSDARDAASSNGDGTENGESGVSFGLLPPIVGPGDGQHDCYAGDESGIRLSNGDADRTIRLIVEDDCNDAVFEETYELEAGEFRWSDASLETGRTYVVRVGDDDGAGGAERIERLCWGVEVRVDDAGTRIDQIAID